jgi:hypothetical protein
MRTILLSSFALLFIAGSAAAFSINHTTNYDGVSVLATSDTVTVHVFIDSEGAGVATPITNAGINILSVGVIFTSPNLVFSGGPGGTSPYAYLNYYYPPNTPPYTNSTYNGSQSDYILDTFPQPGTGAFTQLSYAYLVPFYSPVAMTSAWQTWPAPRVGQGQVNLNWVPPGSLPDLSQQVRATTNTWLGSIVLHVAETTGGAAQTGLFVDGTCCLIRTGDGVDHRSTTTLDAPTTLALGPLEPTATPTATATATPTPSATLTPTATPTPSTIPGSCVWLSPPTTIFTIAKGQSAENNAKVAHAISGNIIEPQLLKISATRIRVCEGTAVTISTFDTTGEPSNTISGAVGGGFSCDSSGCTISSVEGTVKYISRSADGKDTDRITIVPK